MKKINLLLVIIMIIVSSYMLTIVDPTRRIIIYSLVISLIPIYILKKLKLDRFTTVYIIFIFLSHFMGAILNLYYTLNFYDKFTHFMSGILVSLIVIELFKNKVDKSILLILIISINLSVASLWEFFEFFSDFIFKGDAQRVLISGVGDTMLDMISAFIASIITSIVYKRSH